MEQDAVKEYGMVMNEGILTLSIIGEIEGHDCIITKCQNNQI